MRKVLILGSTGSIGTQALEVIAASEELQAVGLAAGRGWETTVAQAREHGVRRSRSPTPTPPRGPRRPGTGACWPARRACGS